MNAAHFAHEDTDLANRSSWYGSSNCSWLFQTWVGFESIAFTSLLTFLSAFVTFGDLNEDLGKKLEAELGE